jgi:hypothetical protein
MKERIRKARQFVKDHDDAFFTAGIIVFYTACGVALVAIAGKAIQQQKEQDEWIAEQNYEGKAVYRLANGNLLAVSKDQVS